MTIHSKWKKCTPFQSQPELCIQMWQSNSGSGITTVARASLNVSALLKRSAIGSTISAKDLAYLGITIGSWLLPIASCFLPPAQSKKSTRSEQRKRHVLHKEPLMEKHKESWLIWKPVWFCGTFFILLLQMQCYTRNSPPQRKHPLPNLLPLPGTTMAHELYGIKDVMFWVNNNKDTSHK